MRRIVQLGMKTFDQSLFELYQAGEISYEDAAALRRLGQRGAPAHQAGAGGDARTLSQGLDGVEIAEAR